MGSEEHGGAEIVTEANVRPTRIASTATKRQTGSTTAVVPATAQTGSASSNDSTRKARTLATPGTADTAQAGTVWRSPRTDDDERWKPGTRPEEKVSPLILTPPGDSREIPAPDGAASLPISLTLGRSNSGKSVRVSSPVPHIRRSDSEDARNIRAGKRTGPVAMWVQKARLGSNEERLVDAEAKLPTATAPPNLRQPNVITKDMRALRKEGVPTADKHARERGRILTGFAARTPRRRGSSGGVSPFAKENSGESQTPTPKLTPRVIPIDSGGVVVEQNNIKPSQLAAGRFGLPKSRSPVVRSPAPKSGDEKSDSGSASSKRDRHAERRGRILTGFAPSAQAEQESVDEEASPKQPPTTP